ncbi:transposase family protein [Poseidonocella sp. HB161398]|uniref:transposase family protein n=1 Tax=Poseidonocella sp. HB161398 TaxID=2320855 RepID=UPI001F0D1CFA|nr:transposase family protein [Poseidonocella sp. HB161398]
MQIFRFAFDDIPDPQADNARHDLGELLVIAFVAVLCGATTCAGMATFGRAKKCLFRGFLNLKTGKIRYPPDRCGRPAGRRPGCGGEMVGHRRPTPHEIWESSVRRRTLADRAGATMNNVHPNVYLDAISYDKHWFKFALISVKYNSDSIKGKESTTTIIVPQITKVLL